MRPLTFCALAVMVLAGCANEGPEEGASPAAAPSASQAAVDDDVTPRPLPTHDGEGDVQGAVLVGELGGSADVDGGCLWIEDGGDAVSVLWPTGYAAAFEPTRLLGPDGEIIATEGDSVELGGGFVDEPSWDRCLISDAVWVAGSEVSKVEATE